MECAGVSIVNPNEPSLEWKPQVSIHSGSICGAECFPQKVAWDTLTLSGRLDWDFCWIPSRLQRYMYGLSLTDFILKSPDTTKKQSSFLVGFAILCPVFQLKLGIWQHQKTEYRYIYTSVIWCVHPWRITYGRYRNMTKLLCSCHSGANVNIWRAFVLSSQEMNTGIRGRLTGKFNYMNNHNFSVVMWCDGADMTSMRHVNRMRWGQTKRQWKWLIVWL